MDMVEGIAGKEAEQEYITDSNEALQFTLVRTAEDLESGEVFPPEMTHQIYGDGEQIFGYRDLEIRLFISAARLNMYCDVRHDGKINSSGMEPDDIVTPLSELVPPNTIMDNHDTFLAMLKKEISFKPFGDHLRRHTVEKGEPDERTFEVYVCSESTPGFLSYFERAQMFTMFYIDAASYIDTDDHRWRFFLVFERYTEAGSTMYGFAGFTTVYEFYGYPSHVRPRISQMLVLPPFQRMGLGTAMLETIYKHYIDDPKCLTIAVEDPSPVFSGMRLLLDCRSCLELPMFSRDHLLQGITKQHYEEARTKLKLNKESVRNVFNVLRLRTTDRSHPESYRSFRLFLKNQLYAQFRRQDKDAAKLSRYHVSQEEIDETLSFVPKDKRPAIIHQEYMDLEARLMAVVDKLPKLKDI